MTTTNDRSLETALTKFLAMLAGKNRSDGTIQAYGTDVTQFLTYLTENDLTVRSPADVTKSHLTEYMTYLSRERALSGVSCARKLATHLARLSPFQRSPQTGFPCDISGSRSRQDLSHIGVRVWTRIRRTGQTRRTERCRETL